MKFKSYKTLKDVRYAEEHGGIRVVKGEHKLQVGDVVTLPFSQPKHHGKIPWEEKVGWDLGIYYPDFTRYGWYYIRSITGHFFGEVDLDRWKWVGLNVKLDEWNEFWRNI